MDDIQRTMRLSPYLASHSNCSFFAEECCVPDGFLGGKLMYDELCRLFPISEFIEAAGVLEMIQQTPEQNHLYSLRLKAQTDEASKLESTRIEALT